MLRHTRVPAVAAAVAVAVGVVLASSGAVRSRARPAGAAAVAVPAGILGLALCLPAAVNVVGGRRVDAGQSGRGRVAGGRVAGGRLSGGRTVLTDAALLSALVLAGGLRYELAHTAVGEDSVALLPVGRELVLRAQVREVRRSESGTSVVIEALSASADAEPANREPGCLGEQASGLVWARWPDQDPEPAQGDTVTLRGELSAPRGRRNPGAFDFAAYLRGRRIHRTLGRCRLLERSPRGARAGLREWVYATVTVRVPGPPGEVLRGLLLGARSEMPRAVERAFRRTGTVHVLAVSGLHVGFVVLIVHALLRVVRVPRRLARLLILPALLGFVAVVGPRPSVVRAGTMAAFLIGASLLERKPSPLNALGASAAVLMIVRPGCLFDLGFGLSFSAVAAILLLHGPLERRIARALRGLGTAGRRASGALALSVAAQLGVSPMLVRSFGELSAIAPIANLVVVPLAGVSVASGLAMLASEPLGPWPSSAFAAAAWASCRLLVLATERLGQLPFASVRIAASHWHVLACLTVGLCLRARARGRRRRVVGVLLIAGAVLVACALSLTGPGRSYHRVVFFDVGQGDSILIEAPRRRYALVDAGPGPGASGANRFVRDAGRNEVVPYLRREAVARLDFLVITHAHADHFGGAASVLTSVAVDTLVLAAGSSRAPRLRELVDLARSRGTGIREVVSSAVLKLGETRVDVLSPPGPRRERRAGIESENDRSVVLRVRVSGRNALLTGDIERPAESRLCGSGSELSADLFKVPHHGSGSSSTTAFLRRVAPSLSVIQVGAGNRHGHPDESVLSRLEAHGIAVARTDLDGAVLVSFRGGAMTAECVASGRRFVEEERRPGTDVGGR